MLNLCSTNLLNQPKFLGTLALSLGSRGASLFYSFYGLLLMKSKEFSFSLKIRIATNDYSPFFFFGAYLCICQNGFLLLVHNAHTGRLFTELFSCIYYIWLGGLWVYHVGSLLLFLLVYVPQIKLVFMMP